MAAYLVRRVLASVATLLGLSFLVFTLVSLVPGDPAEQLAQRTAVGGEPTPEQIQVVRERLRLDDPFFVQYGRWLGNAVQGDLGRSFSVDSPVRDEIARRLPATAALAAGAFVLTICLAIPLGTAAALLHGKATDHLLRVTALFGASIPGFFLAYLLISLFAVRLHLLPVSGMQGPLSMVLPIVVLAAGPVAVISRLLRSSLLEVLGEDFIRTAFSKGLTPTRVVTEHALRNAAAPVVTVLGGLLAGLLEGAVITEVIFAWPGVGLLTLNAIGALDYPMVQGTVLFAGVVFISLNLLVDMSYSVLDPQVRL